MKNQKELGDHEMSVTKCQAIIDTGMINANAFRADYQMSYYLFLLPENWIAYDPAVDDEPSATDRPIKINLRRLEGQYWEVDPKTGDYEYKVWWGHFLFCVTDVDARRKMIVEKEEEEEGLLAAFSHGMAF